MNLNIFFSRVRKKLEIELINSEDFIIDAGDDLTLQFGEISDLVRLQSNQTIVSVSWSPKQYLNCPNCEDVMISGVGNLTYQIEAINETGCVASDSIQVFVDGEDIQIYVPNAFSPNGDGANDYFTLYTFENTIANIISMRVFNRWGGLLFDANNIPANTPLAGWDGRVKGSVVQSGVYTYLFEIELIDGRQIQRSGTVTVLY